MQKSVLLEIIRSLNKKEQREIQKWLLSPAHNQRQDVVKLFDYMCKSLTNGDEVLVKERAWKAIFPGEDFDDARMRQTMYFLLQNVEEFLAFTELSKDTVHIQSVLLKVYRNRQLERPFRMTMEAARKRQQQSPHRNSAYLREQHTLEQEQYYYLVGQKWSMELNLQETANALDLAYLADKLRISCLMLSHQYVYQRVSYDMGTLSSILSYVEQQNLLNEPAIAIYYYSFKALTERDDESHFNELEKNIFEKGHFFPLNELRESYLFAINYCVSRLNTGLEAYALRAFELYRTGFEQGILLENGIISKMSFGNAVSIALRIKEFEWAEKFIHNFQQHLEEKHRNSMVHFNLSRLHFERSDYDKAQRLLTQFEYDDMVLNMVAKTMLLKIYYEQGELDAFESLIEAMRSYLQRKEALSQNHKVVYKNFISLMKKLLHLNPYSKIQTDRLRNLVLTTQPLIERDWLLRQLDQRR